LARGPLALGSPVCLWGKVTEEALQDWPRPTHPLFFSKNYSAVITVVRAGLAATALPVGMVGDDLQPIGAELGLPELPSTSMGLIFAPGRASAETKALADAIRVSLADHSSAAA